MAQGDFLIFDEHVLAISKKLHNYDTDTHKISLHNTALPTTTASPDYSDFTASEVTGAGYTTAGATATCACAEADGTATFTLSSNVAWTQNGSGPTDIKYGLLYSTTAASEDAIGTIDMRNGTSAISLQDGDITIAAGTVFTLSK